MSSVGLMGSSVCQGAVVPTMAIPPEKAGQADLSLPAIATVATCSPVSIAFEGGCWRNRISIPTS